MTTPSQDVNPDSRWSVAPLWQVRRTVPPRKLAQDLECDTVVVGAGITGLSVAAALCDKQKVVVLEKGLIGEGATGWSAGIVAVSTTVDLREVEACWGQDKARSLAFFLTEAVLRMKNNAGLGEEDWQSGSSLYMAARPGHTRKLKEELELRQEFGGQGEILNEKHLKAVWKGFPAALEVPGEHAVHPVKLLLALASMVAHNNGHVHEQTGADSWSHAGESITVRCGEHTVTARNLVICAGLAGENVAEFRDLQKSSLTATSHVLVTERSFEFHELATKAFRIAMWDSLNLYHYVRYLSDGRVLVGGCEQAGARPAAALPPGDPRIQSLWRWAQQHHKITLPPVDKAWRGSLTVPADGMPMLKARALGENIVASALTDGLPSAFLLAEIVAGLLLQGEHPLSEMFSAGRKLPPAARALSLLPVASTPRRLALEAAFRLMELQDRFG